MIFLLRTGFSIVLQAPDWHVVNQISRTAFVGKQALVGVLNQPRIIFLQPFQIEVYGFDEPVQLSHSMSLFLLLLGLLSGWLVGQ